MGSCNGGMVRRAGRGTDRNRRRVSFLIRLCCALALIAPDVIVPAGFAQTPVGAAPAPAPAPDAAAPLSQAQLEQLLAPIALYPDDLLTQVLIASTYPLEVALASRWVEQPANKALKGDALAKALQAQDWDPSVKSLVPFPAVLKTMSDQLDWTQQLGDAFLAQQAAVFAAVQALRGRAQAAGSLKSTPQQTVAQENSAIVIQPAQPDTVYVPAYNPTVVYGTWPYPAYPPVYYPPPPGAYLGSALATGLAFGAGVALVGSLWGWGNANWGGGDVYINNNRFNAINANRAASFNRAAVTSNTWQHDPAHRRGVGYANSQLRQQYRPAAGNSASREAFRGREPGSPGGGAGIGNGGAGRPGAGAGIGNGGAGRPGGGAGIGNGGAGRPGGGAGIGNGGAGRPGGGAGIGNGGAGRPGGGAGIGGGGAGRPGGGAVQRPAGAPAFQGIGNGGAARAQSAQGRASRAGALQRGAGGGGARGGMHAGGLGRGGGARGGGGAHRGGRR